MTSQPDPASIRILVADEDDHARAFLCDNLAADGFDVEAVADYSTALARLRASSPQLVLVDVNGRTLALIDQLRASDSSLFAVAADTPIVVLTSRRDDIHRVRLLDRGGDDVLIKPFSYPELLARIRAVLRRAAPRLPAPILHAGPVRIDVRRRQVTVADRPIELTATEYELLHALAAEPTRVFTRQELMRDVFGFAALGRTRTLDSHCCRLRAKLANDTTKLVTNIWGVGYRLLDR